MRITCPSCHATYEVPNALLGDGARKVRCARCAFEWVPQPAAGPPTSPSEPPAPRARPDLRLDRMPRTEPQPPLPAPHIEREPPPSLRARSRPIPALASIAAVATSVLVLIALGWAIYAWRAEVMQAWPPSQRLFAALGLQ
jgi:predicted Zn finger-like uncharacterized protein